jgi:hypothetical protein
MKIKPIFIDFYFFAILTKIWTTPEHAGEKIFLP